MDELPQLPVPGTLLLPLQAIEIEFFFVLRLAISSSHLHANLDNPLTVGTA